METNETPSSKEPHNDEDVTQNQLKSRLAKLLAEPHNENSLHCRTVMRNGEGLVPEEERPSVAPAVCSLGRSLLSVSCPATLAILASNTTTSLRRKQEQLGKGEAHDNPAWPQSGRT
jgi:hypothetical protein